MHCSVVELRQYTLHPGQRGTLIDIFDREFVETQEAVGMQVLGQFRVLDDPDVFFWLRGFAGMSERHAGLSAFYGGPVWRAHRDAANATMIDSDNVLLLRPARPDSGFDLSGLMRPAPGSGEESERLYVAAICYLAEPAGDEVIERFEREVRPAVEDGGGSVGAYFVSEHSPNTYPALPVREGENALAWFTAFPNAHAYDHATHEAAAKRLSAQVEIRRLAPTRRSLLR